MKRAYFYDTSCGKIGLAEEDGAITNVFFGNTVSPKEFTQEETPLLKQAAAQLKEYLAGKRQKFDIFLCPRGTEFLDYYKGFPRICQRANRAVSGAKYPSPGDFSEIFSIFSFKSFNFLCVFCRHMI